jgi:hypothetical protein
MVGVGSFMKKNKDCITSQCIGMRTSDGELESDCFRMCKLVRGYDDVLKGTHP